MGGSRYAALQAAPTSIPDTLSAATSLLQYNSGLAAFRSATEDEAATRAAATESALIVHKVRTVNGKFGARRSGHPLEIGVSDSIMHQQSARTGTPRSRLIG